MRITQRLPAALGFLVAMAACSGSAHELRQLLACHDAAVGGPTLRSWHGVTYDLDIREPSYSLTARYSARRPGSMRIDVYAGEERVFSEWLDHDGGAYEQVRGAVEGVEVGGEAAASLRHGLEQPGHLWTLADMRPNGHHLEWEPRDSAGPSAAHAVRLTLRDGFTQWLWVDPTTCQIVRQRSFRAFHPSADSSRTWIETRFVDFETHWGVTKAMRSVNLDLATGDTLGVTRLRTVTPLEMPNHNQGR